MTRNTMLYDHVHEGIDITSVNDFNDDDDQLKQQPEQVDPIPTIEEFIDPSYLR